jgi:RNA polymerase sigma-70 factor (ECF subfamily)
VINDTALLGADLYNAGQFTKISKPERLVLQEHVMIEAELSDQGSGGPTTPPSLLERARRKDEGAWCRLVALYRPLVLYWCGRAGLSPSDAEDVAQEVLASVAGSLGSFHSDRPGSTFRGWLRVITRNAILAHARRNAGPRAEGGEAAWERLQGVADPLAAADGDEAAEIDRLYRGAVGQVRGEFEERTWQAFWRTAIEGRSPASLVEELGMSVPAIRQARSRVLRRLKQEMGNPLCLPAQTAFPSEEAIGARSGGKTPLARIEADQGTQFGRLDFALGR